MLPPPRRDTHDDPEDWKRRRPLIIFSKFNFSQFCRGEGQDWSAVVDTGSINVGATWVVCYCLLVQKEVRIASLQGICQSSLRSAPTTEYSVKEEVRTDRQGGPLMRSLKKGTYTDRWMRGMMAISFKTYGVAEGAAHDIDPSCLETHHLNILDVT